MYAALQLANMVIWRQRQRVTDNHNCTQSLGLEVEQKKCMLSASSESYAFVFGRPQAKDRFAAMLTATADIERARANKGKSIRDNVSPLGGYTSAADSG